MAAAKKTPKSYSAKPKVSTLTPNETATQVCYTKPARKERRVHTPSDLRRIYRYVVGSHGWKAATCAILDESGIKDFLDAELQNISDLNLCAEQLVPEELAPVLDYVPESIWSDADELMELEEGTVSQAIQGCTGDEDNLTVGIRVFLGILILIWGIWKKIRVSLLYRLVLRRFIVLGVLFAVLNKIEDFLTKLVPLIEILASISTQLSEVCEDGDTQADDKKGSA